MNLTDSSGLGELVMPLSAIHERFRVSCLPKAAAIAQEWRATHVISLIDPGIADEHVPVIRDAEHIVARLRDQENSLTRSPIGSRF